MVFASEQEHQMIIFASIRKYGGSFWKSLVVYTFSRDCQVSLKHWSRHEVDLEKWSASLFHPPPDHEPALIKEDGLIVLRRPFKLDESSSGPVQPERVVVTGINSYVTKAHAVLVAPWFRQAATPVEYGLKLGINLWWLMTFRTYQDQSISPLSWQKAQLTVFWSVWKEGLAYKIYNAFFRFWNYK